MSCIAYESGPVIVIACILMDNLVFDDSNPVYMFHFLGSDNILLCCVQNDHSVRKCRWSCCYDPGCRFESQEVLRMQNTWIHAVVGSQFLHSGLVGVLVEGLR